PGPGRSSAYSSSPLRRRWSPSFPEERICSTNVSSRLCRKGRHANFDRGAVSEARAEGLRGLYEEGPVQTDSVYLVSQNFRPVRLKLREAVARARRRGEHLLSRRQPEQLSESKRRFIGKVRYGMSNGRGLSSRSRSCGGGVMTSETTK